MSATAKPPRKRLRKREAIKRRAALKRYVAELERVPPLVAAQAAPLIAILLGR